MPILDSCRKCWLHRVHGVRNIMLICNLWRRVSYRRRVVDNRVRRVGGVGVV